MFSPVAFYPRQFFLAGFALHPFIRGNPPVWVYGIGLPLGGLNDPLIPVEVRV